jgi:exonuclease SbcC
MRPINITISAFGPYAGEIKLNMDDLGDKGLYLITGDTGAGKTTIFDAICFALFGEASGGSREATMLRSKYADPDTPTFVELSFTHGGKEFYIKRNPEYMRPAKRGDGEKKELPNAELRMPDGSVITKVRDVNNAVVELLGIDRTQFSQIAMLAQGDFLKLLLADTKERQLIFRKLFKTEYYQTLQERLESERKKCYVACEDAKKSVKQYISGIQCQDTDVLSIEVDKAKAGEMLTEDVLVLIEKLLGQDLEIRDKAQEQIDALDKELETVNQNIGKARQLEKAQTDLERAQADLETELPRQKELKEKLEQAEEKLPEKDEYQKLQAQIEAELPRYNEYEGLLGKEAELNKAIIADQSGAEKAAANAQGLLTRQEELKKELTGLQNAGADREKLLAEYKNSQDKENRLAELADKIKTLKEDEKSLEKARTQYIELDKEYQEKSVCYEHLFKAYRDGQAGVLAGTLEEGKPCPVCGSLTHPSPATLEGEVPTDAELKASKKAADTARDAVEKASRKCGELGSSFDANKKNVAGELVTVSGSDVQDQDTNLIKIEAMANLVSGSISKVREQMMDTKSKLDEADKLIKRKESIEKELPDIEKQLEEARNNESSFKEKLAADKSALEAVKKQSEELKKSFKFESKKGAEEKISELKKLADTIQRAFDNADKEVKAHSERINLLKGQIKGLQETIDKSEKADLEKELNRKQELETSRTEANSLFNGANLRIEANESARTGIDKKCSELSGAEKRLSMVAALSDTASGKLSGKEKIMLETYIQTTYFDRIIARANLRFMKMSDAQYELKRLEEAANNRGQSGLDLGVIDHYNGSQRSVKTLSGGESFMAALSLALGLSDEIQSSAGGIQIDTMFVDEGFGTLDSDSLELAYNALAGLTEGNRLVGIISHVTELKDKIDKQIVVTKEKSGGSKAQIII